MALNCAAMPDNVAERAVWLCPRRLWQHRPGQARGTGRRGGTLMLDGSATCPPSADQVPAGAAGWRSRRVGDEQEVKVNVRFICTTQKQLLDLVHEGKFGKTSTIASTC